jgi:hypothetical protein
VRATFEAYFDFVAHESGAFRLIFESDLTNVPEAASRVQRTNETCALMIAEVIREDTELEPDVAMMLAMGLLGMAQTAARHWLHSPAPISQEGAARAMSALAWRGISGFPLTAQPATVTGQPGAAAESSPAAESAGQPGSTTPGSTTPAADTDVTAAAPVADASPTPKTRSAGAKAPTPTSARARSRSTR